VRAGDGREELRLLVDSPRVSLVASQDGMGGCKLHTNELEAAYSW
jgi:hypothetical protein